jgi:hypothetical protein
MSMQPVDPLTRWALAVYTASLAAEALQAYAVRGVSLPWMGQCLTLAFVAFLLLQTRLVRVPGLAILGLLLAWGSVVTLANSTNGQFENLMPVYATTPYPVFVALRLVSISAFGAQIYLVYWLLARGCLAAVIKRTTVVAVIMAALAIYIYVAQLNGLPVPPRTRLGTSGNQHLGVYTYAFHRAVGTFQEPGDLASWLVLPLFFGFFGRNRLVTVGGSLIAAALLLTGSLAAIAGSLMGVAGALVLLWPFRSISLARALQICLALGAAAMIFHFVAAANEDGSTDLLAVLGDRLRPILNDGIEVSNRDYIYHYVASTPFPPIGVGFGNSNLLLTFFLGSPVMVSFLSVYFMVLYSTGYVGMTLLVMFLLAPLKGVVRRRLGQNLTRPGGLLALTAVYVTYLVMIGFRAEEFPASFGTIYAVLAFLPDRYETELLAVEA